MTTRTTKSPCVNKPPREKRVWPAVLTVRYSDGRTFEVGYESLHDAVQELRELITAWRVDSITIRKE